MGYSDELDSLMSRRKGGGTANEQQAIGRIAVKRVAVPASQIRTLPDGTKIVVDPKETRKDGNGGT
jgi:hypothetical protein